MHAHRAVSSLHVGFWPYLSHRARQPSDSTVLTNVCQTTTLAVRAERRPAPYRPAPSLARPPFLHLHCGLLCRFALPDSPVSLSSPSSCPSRPRPCRPPPATKAVNSPRAGSPADLCILCRVDVKFPYTPLKSSMYNLTQLNRNHVFNRRTQTNTIRYT